MVKILSVRGRPTAPHKIVTVGIYNGDPYRKKIYLYYLFIFVRIKEENQFDMVNIYKKLGRK